MRHLKTWSLAAGLLLAAGAAATAMPPAQTDAGYKAGVSLGASLTNGTKLAAAADLDLGFHTGWFNQPYTAIMLSGLRTGRDESSIFGKTDAVMNLVTLGIRQPLPISGSVPFALEGGLSYLNASADFPAPIGTLKTDETSAYAGFRGTSALSGQTGFTGMFRYHFLSGGIWQAGGGIFGPLGKSSGLYYTLDYYHTDGRIKGFDANTDSILFGVRWSGGV